jgi:tagatose 1,6-diphosphate aldolase GatY/KbaY
VLASTGSLLRQAQRDGYAVGAFNIYNLEGAKAVIGAAEEAFSPVILQIHPKALKRGGEPLLALALIAARNVAIPAVVHLDHSTAPDTIHMALALGVSSIMADGSHLPYSSKTYPSRN